MGADRQTDRQTDKTTLGAHRRVPYET